MSSARTFRKTTFTVTVVSEGPYNPGKLRQIAEDIMTGPHVGTWATEKIETLTAEETVAALADMGSDPEFFHLDAAANDTADYSPDGGQVEPAPGGAGGGP